MADVVGEKAGDSGRQVQRYIRLTELIPELLDMVDEKKIAFNPSYELSFLKKEEQVDLLDAMDSEQATPPSPSPAAEKVQSGGPPDPRHDAGHHG